MHDPGVYSALAGASFRNGGHHVNGEQSDLIELEAPEHAPFPADKDSLDGFLAGAARGLKWATAVLFIIAAFAVARAFI